MSTPTSAPEPTPGSTTWNVREAIKAVVALAVLAVASFFIWRQLQPKPFYEFNATTLAFVDHAQSNAPLDGCDVEVSQFVGLDGQPSDLKQFLGQKNVVLVVTRGNTSGTGPGAYYRNICLYCATQTSRLIANYQAFQDHDAGSRGRLSDPATRPTAARSAQFHEALRRDGAAGEPPFPAGAGRRAARRRPTGHSCRSVEAGHVYRRQTGAGAIRLCGATIADRPSVQSMLEQLAAINADAK